MMIEKIRIINETKVDGRNPFTTSIKVVMKNGDVNVENLEYPRVSKKKSAEPPGYRGQVQKLYQAYLACTEGG